MQCTKLRQLRRSYDEKDTWMPHHSITWHTHRFSSNWLRRHFSALRPWRSWHLTLFLVKDSQLLLLFCWSILHSQCNGFVRVPSCLFSELTSPSPFSDRPFRIVPECVDCFLDYGRFDGVYSVVVDCPPHGIISISLLRRSNFIPMAFFKLLSSCRHRRHSVLLRLALEKYTRR